WGYHLTNVLLHLASTLVLFAALQRLTGAVWRSWLAAALFAVHPLHVESVAWVGERKDVLSGLVWMLTLLAYAAYAPLPSWTRSLLVALAFALGLLATPMLVTLPCVLLLLDFWPLQRLQITRESAICNLQSAIREKLPLFVLAAVSCAVTLYAQGSGGAIESLEHYSLGERVANALVSYVRYLGRAVW